jgi:hypothetical protein
MKPNNKPNFDKFMLPTKFGFIRNWKNVHLKVQFIKPNKYSKLPITFEQ